MMFSESLIFEIKTGLFKTKIINTKETLFNTCTKYFVLHASTIYQHNDYVNND